MREPTPLSGLLRLVMVAVVVGSAVMAGVWRRSPLGVLTLGVGFTGAYVGGKLPQWRRSFGTHGWMALSGLPFTWIVQCVVAGVFYLIGIGLGALFGERLWQPFGTFDVLLGLAVGLLGLVVGPVLDRLEGVGSNAD